MIATGTLFNSSAAHSPAEHEGVASLGIVVCWLLLPAIATSAESSHAPPQVASGRGNTLEEVAVWGSSLQDPAATGSAGSRMNLSIFETPASIEILDAEILRQRGDASIVDAVTRTTGITTVANPGNGGTGLAVRGFSGHGSVMQLYDGMRLYVGAGTVTFPFDPWMAEHIEVLRGPASVLHGEGAVGGAVNIVPRRPSLDQHELETQISYGSYNTVRTALGAGGPVNHVVSYRFDVSENSSEGWLDRAEDKSLALAGTVRIAPADSLSFVLSHDYAEQEPMRYFGTPLIAGTLDDRNVERNYNVSDSAMRYTDNRTRLRTDWQLSQAITLRSELYRLTTDRLWRNAESYFWNGASGQIDRLDYLGIEHDQSQVGNRTDVTIRRPLLGSLNTAVVGLEANRIRFEHTNNFSYEGFSSVDPYAFDPGFFDDPAGGIPAYQTLSHQLAAFAEDRLELNGRWSVVGGIRADRTEVRRDNLQTATRLFEESFDSLGWRFGVVAQLAPTFSSYGQYSTGADPIGSLITTSVAQKDLDLATAAQYEIGLKQSLWENKAQWTVALYQITKKKLLTRDRDNPSVSIQVGERSSRGIEVTLALQPTPAWSVDVNAALLDARFEDFTESSGGALISRNGNVPPGIPEETANLWVTWQFTPGWRVQSGLRYVGMTYSDNANIYKVPEYTILDAAIEWAVTRNVRAGVRGHNLTDERYAATTYNDEQWILGRPRAGELTVNVSF